MKDRGKRRTKSSGRYLTLSLRLPERSSDQGKSQFLCCLLFFELGPYPGDGGDVIVVEGIDEVVLY